MTRLIDAAACEALLHPRDVVAALASAHVAHHHGEIAQPVPTALEIPGREDLDPAKRPRHVLMSASDADLTLVKTLLDAPAGRDAGGPAQRSVLAVHSTRTGDCLALVDGRVVEDGPPATLLAVGDTDRPFARRAFEGRLPASIQQRRGKGDLSVFFSRSLAASAPFLKAYLGDGRLAQRGLLNREVIDATLDADHLIWRDATPDLFVAMALEAWVRRWEDILSDAQAEVLAAV